MWVDQRAVGKRVCSKSARLARPIAIIMIIIMMMIIIMLMIIVVIMIMIK